MKLETEYGDVQLLLETIKDRTEDIVWFADKHSKTGRLTKKL